MKSEIIREDLVFVLGQMKPEDDWFYTAAARAEGHSYLSRAKDLEDEKKLLESEAAVKINKINEDLYRYVKGLLP